VCCVQHAELYSRVIPEIDGRHADQEQAIDKFTSSKIRIEID
jgi:hypothetical protein